LYFKAHPPVVLAVMTEEGTPVPHRTEVFVALTPSIIFADVDIKCFFDRNENKAVYFVSI